MTMVRAMSNDYNVLIGISKNKIHNRIYDTKEHIKPASMSEQFETAYDTIRSRTAPDIFSLMPQDRLSSDISYIKDALDDIKGALQYISEVSSSKGSDDMSQELSAKLIDIEVKLAHTEGKINVVDEKVNGLQATLSRIEARLDKMDERFDKIDDKFEKIDEKLGKMVTKDDLKERIHSTKVTIGIIVSIVSIVVGVAMKFIKP